MRAYQLVSFYIVVWLISFGVGLKVFAPEPTPKPEAPYTYSMKHENCAGGLLCNGCIVIER